MTKKGTAALLLFLIVFVISSGAQPSGHSWDSIRKLTEIDHQRMMTLLNITSLRPGVDGMNSNAPNAANYDEAIANPYPVLPDPLILENGRNITSAGKWWKKRRPEIIKSFDREVYGRVPAAIPAVSWQTTSVTPDTIGNFQVVTKKLTGHVDNSGYPQVSVDLQLNLTIPAGASAPVPVIMELGFVFPPGFNRPGPPSGEPSWQEQILSRG